MQEVLRKCVVSTAGGISDERKKVHITVTMPDPGHATVLHGDFSHGLIALHTTRPPRHALLDPTASAGARTVWFFPVAAKTLPSLR